MDQLHDIKETVSTILTKIESNTSTEDEVMTSLDELRAKIMNHQSSLDHVPCALRLSDHHVEELKLMGVFWLGKTLSSLNEQVKRMGYDIVIFKSLMRILTFDEGQLFADCLELLNQEYYHNLELQDEIMEALLKRAATNNNKEMNRVSLENIINLINAMGDNIAKHSKQLLLFVDQTDMEALDEPTLNLYHKLCQRLEQKLPKRKS